MLLLLLRQSWLLSSLSRVVVILPTVKSWMSLHLSLLRVVVCWMNSVGLECRALLALSSKDSVPSVRWAKRSSWACHIFLIFEYELESWATVNVAVCSLSSEKMGCLVAVNHYRSLVSNFGRLSSLTWEVVANILL